MRAIFCLVVFIFLFQTAFPSGFENKNKHTVSGYVKDNSNGEELIGASVYVEELKVGTTTNVYGFYSLSLPEGEYNLVFSFLGYDDLRKKVKLTEDVKYNASLVPSAELLDAVEIVGERKDRNIKSVEMSVAKIPMKTIKKMPALLGEVDVIKSIQLLPGVLSGSEGSTGFFVRGGGADQNLVLLDGAPVYNASHFIGFFSVFNGDAVKDFKLYKGGIPPEYGGRLSSVLDIQMKDGNSRNYEVTGGIGVLSSRLTVEGPIIEDKMTFLISGRRTYYDVFLPLLPDTNAQKATVYFYDLNTKLNYKINENNRVFLSGYFGKDVMAFGDEFGMNYGNQTGTARWNHLFSSKLFMNTTFVYSQYNYNLFAEQMDMFAMDWVSGIKDYNGKMDLTYFLNPDNTLKAGIGTIYHTFDPGRVTIDIKGAEPDTIKIANNYAYEHSGFIQNEQKITALLSATYGIRFSAFQNVGPGTSLVFDKEDPLKYDVSDTLTYTKGKVFNTYKGWEPRLGLRLITDEWSSVKASYNRTVQYVHLATNTSSSTPIDYWFPCSPNIKPQLADQIALGYFRNFKQDMFETSLEIYYKKMKNVIDFRDHAETLLNQAYEGEIRIGEAYSYGAELYIKKSEGRFNGWISYTYSQTKRRIPEVNRGDWYFAPYDKTNDISIVMNYDATPQLTLSATWVYSTPQPRTFPTGRYEYGGLIVPVYSDRNNVRIFPYHRGDISATYDFMKKGKDRKLLKESSITFSVYNVYFRKNPTTITFKQNEDDPTKTEAEILYLFPIVPSLTYNFKF